MIMIKNTIKIFNRYLIWPLKKLMFLSVLASIEKSTTSNRIYSPRLKDRLSIKLLSSEDVLRISDRYRDPKSQTIEILFSKFAFEKSISKGLLPYIKALIRHNRRRELSEVIDHVLALPMSQKMRCLARICRANDFLGTRDESIKQLRIDVIREIDSLVREKSATPKLRRRLHRILVSNRMYEALNRLLEISFFKGREREYVIDNLSRTKNLMGRFYSLTHLADKNYAPQLNRDDHFCLISGQIEKVSNVGPVKVVAFYLPGYFFNEFAGDEATRVRVCRFLCEVLSAIELQGAAIVPLHQFLNSSLTPTNLFDAVFSYHTHGNLKNWFHIKDSALFPYFTIDSRGYSGWMSVNSEDFFSEPSVPPADYEYTWITLKDSYLTKHISKYSQQQIGHKSLEKPYVFVPLQVIDDAVAELAWIPLLRLVTFLAKELRPRGYQLVVKRHPKCRSDLISDYLNNLASCDGVFVMNNSIHTLIANATAVICVNSGVGFEALLHGKHVITTGRSEYQMATLVATNEDELISHIDRIANCEVDLKKIKLFLHNYIKTVLIDVNDPEKIAQIIKLRLGIIPEASVPTSLNLKLRERKPSGG
jgi:hypothetical protein